MNVRPLVTTALALLMLVAFPSPLVIGALAGATVVAFTIGLWLNASARWRPYDRRIAELMRRSAATNDTGGARRRTRRMIRRARAARRLSVERYLRPLIEAAGSEATPAEVTVASVVLGVAGSALAGLVTSSAAAGLAGAVAGILLPVAWLMWRRDTRQRRFVEQLPDAVRLIASTVRAGHGLPQALEQVVADAPAPTCDILALVAREIRLGSSEGQAFARLALRFPSKELDLVVAAIDVHQQTGASLARILDEITELLRERVRLDREFRALTSQQRISAYVLAALPVVVAAILSLVSREYVGALFTPGPLRDVALVSALMVVLGFVVLRRMAVVDA